jgi:hypothetical protein
MTGQAWKTKGHCTQAYSIRGDLNIVTLNLTKYEVLLDNTTYKIRNAIIESLLSLLNWE